MKRCSRSQQTDFTKKVISKAKKMIDDGVEFKQVVDFIDNEYKEQAKETLGMVDSLQNRKAIEAIIVYTL